MSGDRQTLYKKYLIDGRRINLEYLKIIDLFYESSFRTFTKQYRD